MNSKQSNTSDSFRFSEHRTRLLQSELLAVAGALGMSRSTLQNRARWDEASRGELPFLPYEKLQLMLRDVARAAAKNGTADQRQAVRVAIHRFYSAACLDATESLLETDATDIVPLYQDVAKEAAEANCAAVVAVTSTNEATVERAVREANDELTALARFRDRLYVMAGRLRAARRPSLVRVAQ
jgi:hypothetical protein